MPLLFLHWKEQSKPEPLAMAVCWIRLHLSSDWLMTDKASYNLTSSSSEIFWRFLFFDFAWPAMQLSVSSNHAPFLIINNTIRELILGPLLVLPNIFGWRVAMFSLSATCLLLCHLPLGFSDCMISAPVFFLVDKHRVKKKTFWPIHPFCLSTEVIFSRSAEFSLRDETNIWVYSTQVWEKSFLVTLSSDLCHGCFSGERSPSPSRKKLSMEQMKAKALAS